MKIIKFAKIITLNNGMTTYTIFFGFSYIRHNNDANTNATQIDTEPSINSPTAAICGSPSKICCNKNKPHDENEKKKINLVVLEPSTIICERHNNKKAIKVPADNNVKITDNKQPHINQIHWSELDDAS